MFFVNITEYLVFNICEIVCKVGQAVIDENTPVVDPDAYGIAKYVGELLLKDESSWLSSITLRLPGVMGKEAKTPWIATIAHKMNNNEDVWIYNPDALFNNIVCINDLTDFLVKLIQNSLPGFNMVTLGAKEPLSVYDTVNFLKECLHSKSKICIRDAERISFSIKYDNAERMGYTPKTVSDIITANFIGELDDEVF